MMAGTFGNTIVSSKLETLKILKQNLQSFVDSSNEVVLLATAWLTNDDAIKNMTFPEINEMLENKLAFLGSIDFSDELKSVMDQVKAMQNDMCLLNAILDKLSEKQLTTEMSVESLSDKYSKIEDEKISEIKAELKSIFEKQETLINQNSILEDLENKIGALTKTQSNLNDQCLQQQAKVESCEIKIQTLSDAQSEITEDSQQQQRKMDDHKLEIEELQKHSEQFLQFMSDSPENIRDLKTSIKILDDKSAMNWKQMDALETRVKQQETDLQYLLTKFEEHISSMEEITQKNVEDFQNLLSVQAKGLRKFEKRAENLEVNVNVTSYESRKLYEKMETKYELVCRTVAERLGPLEMLRNIFNKQLVGRNENTRRLDKVYNYMDVLVL
jgi:chromosome segregation ATPase